MGSIPKRIFFISNSIVPLDHTSGGSVVIYRHLKRFRDEGYKVIVIYLNAFSNTECPGDFEYFFIRRKTWHPPFRKKTPALTSLRISLIYKQLNKLFRFQQYHDIVFGVLGEVSNLLHLKIKYRTGTPFYLFFHDDYLFNRYGTNNLLSDSNIGNILQNASYIFAASDALKEQLISRGIDHTDTIYPIPGSQKNLYNELKFSGDRGPRLLTSGSTGPVHFKTLKAIGRAASATGGKFYCCSNLPATFYPELMAGNIIGRPLFRTLDQLFTFIAEEIDILVVFYSFDAAIEPRILTSFPSKFIEYCRLGLPILVVVPIESSIGRWATENKWLTYVDTEDPKKISEQIENLKNPVFRESCRQQCLSFSSGIFAPDFLHRRLTGHLINVSNSA